MTDTLFDDITRDEAIRAALKRVHDARAARTALVTDGVTADDPRMVAANDEYEDAVDALDTEMQR